MMQAVYETFRPVIIMPVHQRYDNDVDQDDGHIDADLFHFQRVFELPPAQEVIEVEVIDYLPVFLSYL